jgi:hypothetical protein
MIPPIDTELSQDDIKVWNEIWKNVYETHYGAFYEELCAEHALKVWRRYDALFKALQLATASGSAVAGWSLWHQDNFRWIVWMESSFGNTHGVVAEGAPGGATGPRVLPARKPPEGYCKLL